MQQVYNLYGRSHVDPSIIGLVAEDAEDAAADVAVRGREEDLTRLEMKPRVLLYCDGQFCCWSSSGEVYVKVQLSLGGFGNS